MVARNREKRRGRRPLALDPKPRILVVTEGRVTEPQYLRGLQRACRNPRVTVEIPPERGEPRTLVEIAKTLKLEAAEAAERREDDSLAYDEVWCAFDVDEHVKLAQALDMARANGIRVALSNPCFELWLYLHFNESPGPQHRHAMQKLLGKCVPGYDKSITFASFQHGYMVAVQRAHRLELAAVEARESGRNPTTSVFHLTESIRGDSDLWPEGT